MGSQASKTSDNNINIEINTQVKCGKQTSHIRGFLGSQTAHPSATSTYAIVKGSLLDEYPGQSGNVEVLVGNTWHQLANSQSKSSNLQNPQCSNLRSSK